MRGLEVKYYRKVEEPCCLVHLNYRELLQINIVDARNVLSTKPKITTRMTQIIQDHEFLANNLKSVHYENCRKLPEFVYLFLAQISCLPEVGCQRNGVYASKSTDLT